MKCREAPKACAQSSFSRVLENLGPEFASAAEGRTPQTLSGGTDLSTFTGKRKILHAAPKMQNQFIGDLATARSSLPCPTMFCYHLDVDQRLINPLASFQIPSFGKGGHC